MLRIAVIGAGRIGKVHAATVAAHPQARLVLVCDPFIEAAKALAEPLGARASTDAADAFSADDVDAVGVVAVQAVDDGGVDVGEGDFVTCIGKDFADEAAPDVAAAEV